MGSNYSQQVSKNTQKVLNNVLTSVTNKIGNENRNLSTAYTRIDFDISGSYLDNCPITISQDSKLSATVMLDAKSAVTNDVMTEITNQLATQIDQALRQTNSGINFGQANTSVTRSDIQQQVETIMKTALQTSINSTLTSNQNITQIIYFRARNLTCKNSPITVTQTSLLELVSTMTSDITLENIVKNSVMNDIMAKVSQTTEQVNKGIDLGLGLVLLAIALVGAVFILPKILKKGGGGGSTEGGNIQDALPKDLRTRAMAFIKKHKVSIAIVSVLLAILIGIGIWLALIKAGIAPNVFLPDIAK
jgi:hypothetical protein